MLVFSGTSVAENGTGGELVGTLSIAGPGFTGPVTYSITSDPSLNFEIGGAGLDELRIKAGVSFDFETTSSYPVGLQGVDSTAGTPKTFSTTISVTVLNVNEAPTNIDLSGTTVSDTATDGFVIGVLSNPLDPDAGDTFTWSLAPGGDPSGNFEVAGTDFRVAAGNTLDNAVNASHTVTLRVTDAGGLTFDKAFAITVTAGASSFAPTDITTLYAWRDPTDAAATVLNGSVAQQLTDRSGNGKHLVQGLSLNQPTSGTVTWNGKNVLSGTGPHFMEELAGTIGTTHTVVLAALVSSTSEGFSSIYSINGASADYQIDAGSTSTSPVAFYNYGLNITGMGSAVTVPATDNINVKVILGLELDAIAGTATIYINGTQVAQDTAYNGTFDGVDYRIMRNRGNNVDIAAEFAGDIVYNAVSASDRQKSEGYLAHSLGLTASLPANHPYKSTAP